MRWLFHVVRASDLGWGDDACYRPESLAKEGFIHASYRDVALESARLYFAGVANGDLRVLAIDPRRLDVPVDVVATPRGPMPHVRGAIPTDAVRVLGVEDVPAHADRVVGTRIGFCSFDGMTLLDLVGPLDAISRIASMGFDATTTCEVVALTADDVVWRGSGAVLTAARYRPALDAYDVLVIPGGPGARTLATDPSLASYLASFPPNRLLATVCTGALLAGAAGRLQGKRATTHRSALGDLAAHGASAVAERVVDEGSLITAAGVTAGLDLGLHVVRRLAGDSVAAAIAAQMEFSGAG